MMEVKKSLPPGDEQLLAEAARVDGDELEQLAPAAAAGEGGAAPDPAAAEAAPIAATLEHEITALAAVVGTTLAQFFPSTKAILTEQKCGELGAALAPVVCKYGIERHFMGFAWRVELQAAIVVVPVVLAMREAIGRDLEQLRQGPATAPGGELDAGGGAPGSPSSPPRKPPRKPPPLGQVVQVS